MCFRDKTFCNFEDCAKFLTCKRGFTEKVRQDSIKWWGNENAPVCFYADKPECFEEIKMSKRLE